MLAAPATIYAQGMVAGIALEEKTGTPMPCIDVMLVRNDGEIVARTRTLGDGAFMIPSPARGVYSLRFRMWGAFTLDAPDDTLAPDVDREMVHRLGFRIASADSGKSPYSDSDPDRPPRPVERGAMPKYPYASLQRRRSGEVHMRYLVNADGSVRDGFTESAGHTEAAFERAVRNFISDTPFLPAYRDHEPVCALVLQRFRFSVREPGAPPTDSRSQDHRLRD